MRRSRAFLAVDAVDPRERGRDRGIRLAPTLPGGLEVYDRLFAAGGIAPGTVRGDALRALDTIGTHRPALAEQIHGVAEGAGVELWRIAALNARTEILARSALVPPGECSTVVRDTVRADGTVHPLGVQTWDWHVELGDHWHLIDSRGATHRYVGITEHGILAKIGVNSAGVALHFNILGHRDDGVGGIPMHVLAALVLEEAESVAHAIELVRAAAIASSGSFLLFDPERAVLLDLSPVGVFEAPPLAPGTRLRTNHFLTPAPRAEEKTVYQPDSGDRYRFLVSRLATPPADAAALLDTLVTVPGEPAVTCLPDFAQPFGGHWASLATVLLDPVARSARVLDGTPAEQATGAWYEVSSAEHG